MDTSHDTPFVPGEMVIDRHGTYRMVLSEEVHGDIRLVRCTGEDGEPWAEVALLPEGLMRAD